MPMREYRKAPYIQHDDVREARTYRPYVAPPSRPRLTCVRGRTRRPGDPLATWERYAYRAVVAASAVVLLLLVAAGEAGALR